MVKITINKRVKKIIIISVVAVIVAGGGFAGFQVFAKSKSSDSTTTFRKVTARNGSINLSVSGSGTVSDSSQITLTALNAGTVDNVAVKQGDTVKAGQVIAHVSETNTAAAVEQKQSALANAQNALSQAKQNLNSLYIKAPISGKVKSVTASAGDDLSTIKALGNLAVISTSRSMTVSFNASGLSLNQGVTVLDTATGKSYDGTITSVSGGGQSNSQGGSSGSIVATINSDDPGVNDTASVQVNGSTVGSGRLQLTSYTAISNSGSGTVSTVYVSENQMVSKSDNLFKLNSDSVQNDINTKSAAVTAAQNDLTQAEQTAAKDTVTSPIDGVVAQLDVKNGDSVSGAGTIAVIMDPQAMQTVLSVDELDISKVSVGQQANITLEAVSGKTFTGTVSQIDPIGTSSNGVTTYNVTVTINNPDGIKVGMNTNAEIITQSKENTIVVSSSAILGKNGTTGYVLMANSLFDTSGKSIKLTNANTQELIQKYGREVTLGLSNENNVEVVSGLNAGDSIAVPITINKAALASLSNTSSGNSFGLGGLSGMGGYGNRRSGGTGNTVTKSTTSSTGTTMTNRSTNGTAGATGTAGNTGTNRSAQ